MQMAGPALALILVNYELPRALMERLWVNATLRVCADGAINRLHDLFATDEERARFIPEYVRGDLDSVEEKVIDYYRRHGSIIIKDSDQDTTDLEKCILLIQQNWSEQQVEARQVSDGFGIADAFALLSHFERKKMDWDRPVTLLSLLCRLHLDPTLSAALRYVC
jgi:thiamine pyrophosphokinase